MLPITECSHNATKVLPVICGQPEWSPRALHNRCQVSNQNGTVAVLMMIMLTSE